MGKSKSRASGGKVSFAVTIDGPDSGWARNVERLAREQGKSLDDVLQQAVREWLWSASGLRRMFDQIREASDLMKRSFQVEGMLVQLARSGGISMGQQTDYLKRAQDERNLYNEQRKNIKRLVREIQRVAAETGLPDAVAAAEKLVVPD